MTVTIDYDVGNLRSMEKALFSLGETLIIARDRKTILKTDKVVLPGVGLSGDIIGELKQYDLVDVICEAVDQGTPFLGVCLGLQLLFAGGEKGHGTAGLDIFLGKIPKTSEHPGLKIPHIGWNSLKMKPEVELFHGTGDGAYAYFVRSYYLKAEDKSVAATSIEYSTVVHAFVEWGNVFAYQFRSERSGKVDLAILKNFIGL